MSRHLRGRMPREWYDLLKAWVATTVIFSILFSPDAVFRMLPTAAVIVALAFVGHELAHRYMARSYGCWAEFRSNDQMLVLGIFMSFLGFVFLAPGAVMFTGAVTEKQRGKISYAGPAVNLGLALLFGLINGMVPLGGLLGTAVVLGFKVNAWLAFFNLLPLPYFDGQKVWAWNRTVYAVSIGLSLALVFL